MQPRTRKITIAIVSLATLVAMGFAVYLSLDPDNYFFYGPDDRAKWVYHPRGVALVCLFMLVEATLALLAFIASRPQALWLRCTLGFALLCPWALLSTMAVMHVPVYMLFHHFWVWLLVLSLLLVALASAMRQLYLRVRGGPPNNSFKPNPHQGGA